MDNAEPKWSEERFHAICAEVRGLLESLQFPSASIQCVPVSGLTGANVVSGSPTGERKGKSSLAPAVNMAEACPWYRGASLLEILDQLPIVDPPTSGTASLRAVVSSVSDGQKGCDVTVKVLRGRLQVGHTVGFLGGADGVATVKQIKAGNDSRPLTELNEREQGCVTLVDRYSALSNFSSLNRNILLT